jgi:hypothetical protein
MGILNSTHSQRVIQSETTFLGIQTVRTEIGASNRNNNDSNSDGSSKEEQERSTNLPGRAETRLVKAEITQLSTTNRNRGGQRAVGTVNTPESARMPWST